MNWFFSIRARLFFALAATVCFSVGSITWRENNAYIAMLTQNTQASLLSDIKVARRSVESGVDENLNRLSLLVREWSASSDRDTRSQRLRSFLKTTNDSVGAFVYSRENGHLQLLASAWTSDTSQVRFGKEMSDVVATRVEDFAQKKLASTRFGTNQTKIIDLRAAARVPMIGLMKRLKEKRSKSEIFLFVAVWHDQILSNFPFGEHTVSQLIDRRGSTVLSPGTLTDKNWRVKVSPASAFDERRANYTEMTRNQAGLPIIVAMGTIPSLDLALVVERNMSTAFQAVELMQKKRFAAGVFLVQMSLLVAWFLSRGITKNLKRLTEQTTVIAGGDLTSKISVESRDETAVLSRAFNHMSDKIKQLLVASAEKAAMDAELVTAESVQKTLFPKHQSSNGPLAIQGFYRPAARCGGDLWGRFEIEEGVEFVYIADAMGHGVTSALVTAITFSILRTFSELFSMGEVQRPSPAMLLNYINRILVESVESKITMTAFMAIIDTKNNEMTFSNAGHNFPLLHRASDKKRPVNLIRPGGMILGLEAESIYKNHVQAIAPGDKIVLFTDGLIEGTNSAGRQWGLRSLKNTIQASAGEPAQSVRDQLLNTAFQYFGVVPAEDDITLVVIEYQSAMQRVLPAAS